MIKHFNIRFHGSVQGVFFRDFIKKQADILGIKGFVRNDPDGTVYAEAEGEEENIKKFIDLCKEGPDFSKVNKVEAEEGEIKDFTDFLIQY